MRWFGMLAGLVLLFAVVGGVGAMACQAGLDARGVTQVVQAAPAGAEGGTVIVRGMYAGYGYGYGHPFGFFHFLFFILFVGFIFKIFAFGFGGRHRGGWGHGPEGFEEAARRRHDEWHSSGTTGGTTGGTSGGAGTEPPSAPAGA